MGKTVYIFDVDGVLTNPSLKKIEHKEILNKIAKLLENNLVALNTGRSLAWILERVINPLIELVEDKDNLENFYAVGEKGGTWLSISKSAQVNEFKDEQISTPLELRNKVRELIESEFADTTFFDNSKETMVSAEMNDGQNPEEGYRAAQNQLITKLKKILEEEGLDKNFKIDPTTIATDIENKIVGKDFGVNRIIAWFKAKNVIIDRIICFGDSKSDIPMAQEIYKMGYAPEFVYVGKDALENYYPFKVIYAHEKYDRGTLEYLNHE